MTQSSAVASCTRSSTGESLLHRSVQHHISTAMLPLLAPVIVLLLVLSLSVSYLVNIVFTFQLTTSAPGKLVNMFSSAAPDPVLYP
mmetsp:Transcript_2900/g.3902  ORF Transcript_2900/g.3902 Transcript_2900/m.3902 type:complete len:86 (+) Transcript_2900:115-372(+)